MNRLYVGNLSYSTTDAGLRAFFEEAGEVTEAEVVIDRASSRSKGFAFVTMATDEAAQNAINILNGRPLDNRELRIDFAKPKEDRPRTGGGGAGGGERVVAAAMAAATVVTVAAAVVVAEIVAVAAVAEIAAAAADDTAAITRLIHETPVFMTGVSFFPCSHRVFSHRDHRGRREKSSTTSVISVAP